MHRLPSLRSLLLSLAVLVPLAVAAPAQARVLYGIGDQGTAMFADRNFQRLGLDTSRYVIPWDWYQDPYQTMLIDQWVPAAEAAGVRPLISFGRNWRPGGERVLPSRFKYLKSFRMLRERFPQITDFGAWNEANHTTQPTSRKPRAAAHYFNWMREACPTCTIVAADVLDSSDMPWWIGQFKRYAPTARLWGLHNYKDANNGTTVNTRTLLKIVKGTVWLTETGGIKRLKPHPGSRGNGRTATLKGQALAVKRVFALAKLSKRIKRVYFYQWRHATKNRWDSAFVDEHGKPRPALAALRSGLRK
ncbi:MAG: hypothetical protein QOF17_909 [Solirubrobacteraceae bacterium]|jgi:hypothetical protein|nr:hypothetical protein [Solirubrobacteraceae bacterium]